MKRPSLLCFVLLSCCFAPTTMLASASVNLPFGDVNVVVLTDVHSWIGGHNPQHEPLLNVDYGNIVSFVEILRQQEPDRDIFVVNNGDVIDGTGLSTPYPPSHLTAILKFMPWDALTIGNHELYENVNIDYMLRQGGYVEHWKDKYLTSNVLVEDDRQPIGNRFTYLRGTNTGITILTFGFLYDFQEHCDITSVENVEDVVQSDWFVSELSKTDAFDAILVLAHMDVDHPLVHVMLNASRAIVGPDMPIQFITGHTHYRGHSQLDPLAHSLEAGRYLDTVGFVSFATKQHAVNASSVTNTTGIKSNNVTSSSELFQHVFLDANLQTLQETLGVEDMTTSSGSALSSLIRETRQDLGLNNIVACSSQNYYLAHGLDEKDSLWNLYLTRVIMQSYFRYNTSKVLIQSTGSFRYDLFDGNVTLDDVFAVSPFQDDIFKVSERTRGSDILQAFASATQVNGSTAVLIDGQVAPLPEYVMTGTIHADSYYDLYTLSTSVKFVSETLRNVTGDTDSFEPQQQFETDGTPITTHSVWMDYVTHYWKCNDDGIVQVTNRWLIALFSVVAACVFFGFRFWNNATKERRAQRQGYDNAIATDEEDNMIL